MLIYSKYVENNPLFMYLVDGQFLDLLSSGLILFLGFLYICIVAHTKSTYKTNLICRFRVSDYIFIKSYIIAHTKSTYKTLYVDLV